MSTEVLYPPRRSGSGRLLWCLGFLLVVAPACLAQSEDQPPIVSRYDLTVALDPASKIIRGTEKILWQNQTSRATQDLYLHLYLNAFRNLRSSFAREGNMEPFWDSPDPVPDNYWGWINVDSIKILPSRDFSDLEVTGREFVQPDDENADDRTVLRLDLNEPVLPGHLIEIEIEFTSKLPRGIARTGWVDDYFFAAQWFPKLGVLEEGGWNCHQYHGQTEYFADFSDYDVKLTVPAGFVVGGSGDHARRDNADGTFTYRFVQDRVHDFAWTASPRFLAREQNFFYPGLSPVTVRLLVLRENEALGDRYFEAARHALRTMGEWFGTYPYRTLTIVDPAYGSDTGGMEYPTFITGGARYWAPRELLSPESVTIHEVGHQWWYAVVASNEFEEAWLDEGINSWAESRVQREVYPPVVYAERFFGIPLLYHSLTIPFETAPLPSVRRLGKLDVMTRTSWQSLNSDSYGVNSYRKPELVLWTLEQLLGSGKMLEAMRTYFQQYSMKHPTTEDFIDTLTEVSGNDLDWFFEQTFFSSELVDYAVDSATSRKLPGEDGSDEEQAEDSGDTSTLYRSEIVIRRLEGAQLPVDIRVVFDDGEEITEAWDGREPWHRLVFEKPSRLSHVIVDPARKILLDIDPTNNSLWAIPEKRDGFSTATYKWSSKWLFWVQNLLETFAFLG